jgi:hypothetical protein
LEKTAHHSAVVARVLPENAAASLCMLVGPPQLSGADRFAREAISAGSLPSRQPYQSVLSNRSACPLDQFGRKVREFRGLAGRESACVFESRFGGRYNGRLASHAAKLAPPRMP